VLRDALDQQILALLVDNGRATYAELGETVGLSAPATKRRVDRLVDEGTITGFTTIVDPAAIGNDMEAFVELHCRGTTSPATIQAIVAPHHAVVAAYTVSGDADALVHLRCAGVAELEDTLEVIRADERVVRTSTVIVLSRLIDHHGRHRR
jgi:DNA-binding Lrp family transcriptional regulator